MRGGLFFRDGLGEISSGGLDCYLERRGAVGWEGGRRRRRIFFVGV